MEPKPAKLRIFRIKNGKRAFKPESTFKFITELAARDYIDKHEICFYDLYVGEKLIDRNGGGAVEKYDKPAKAKEPKEITYVDFVDVINYITEGANVILYHCYELNKGSGMIAMSCKTRDDANAVYKFVKNSEHVKVLEVLQSSLSLSIETTDSHFTKTKQWEKNQNPLPTAMPKSLPKEQSSDCSELKNVFKNQSF